ncbi:Fe-S cluster assembly ATPase SufC [Alphaproteobacteria bacterium]|nr:Fe-S cluster assembly ATPase SufC [Alphaproteobacteria bacterium]
MSLLEIKNAHLKLDNKEILKGVSLSVNKGEVHAIMGPNGSGKSTLSYMLAGREGYELETGEILLEGNPLNEMSADERARSGLFLAFQYPVELPGVGGISFLREAVNSRRKFLGEEEFDHLGFVKEARKEASKMFVKDEMLKRAVNVGFSGGEKKRFEILQMAMLKPKVSILDETDSGLDVDALKIVSEGVNAQRNKENAIVVITHYQRLLDYIVPDFVHILSDGAIIKSGGPELALEVEKNGYAGLINAA